MTTSPLAVAAAKRAKQWLDSEILLDPTLTDAERVEAMHALCQTIAIMLVRSHRDAGNAAAASGWISHLTRRMRKELKG